MKKLIFLAFFGLFALAFHSSCKKDWLTPPPENTLISSDSTFFEPANAEKFVNSCYSWGISWGQHVFSWIGMSSIASDDADKGSAPGDLGTDKDQMDELTYSSTSLSPEEVWVANYTGIGRCNQAIDKVPSFTGLDQATSDRLVGEAKFLRAYYYFNLVRCFGDVPKFDRVYTSEETEQIYADYSRTPAADIYALIEADLRDAAAKLPLKNAYAPKDLGRATKGSAQGLLAKVLLYQKKWTESLAAANDVINSGQYSLEPEYGKIFRQSGEHGSESLFEFEGQNGKEGWGIGGYAGCQLPRGGLAGGFDGWGFNTPSDDLMAAFEAGDVRKSATAYGAGDILWDNDTVKTPQPNPRYNFKAYISKKMEDNYDGWSSNKNLRILRYGEILLIKAEAANELGSGDAKAALDQVRQRAGLAPSSATSQGDLRTAIWRERRVELAMEHDRFFDLIRTGQAEQVLRAHGKNFVKGKHELFPIPQSQINLSSGRLTQNPGY